MKPVVPANGATEIPSELKSSVRWVVWRYEERNGKPTKVPYDARRGTRAASDDPQTWCSFEEAVRAHESSTTYAGVGFMLGDGWTGIDLDKCRSAETGVIEDWAVKIISEMDSYTEVSPSGLGIHILIRGHLPKGRKRTGRIEMYDRLRYFTITGQIVGEHQVLQERQAELEALHARIFSSGAGSLLPGVSDMSGTVSDADLRVDGRPAAGLLILDPKAIPPFEKFDLLCEVEAKFRLSWEHKRGDFDDQSASAYDQSLANLAAMARWNDQEIANLLIAHRRKHSADLKLRQDYFDRTIAAARQAAEPMILDQRIMELVNDGASGESSAPTTSANDDDFTPPESVAGEQKQEPQDPQAGPAGDGHGAGGIQQDQAHSSARRGALLVALSARFKVPIKRIVKYTGEPTQYRLETAMGNVQLGGVAGLINQSKLRVSIADATGRYLPPIDPEKWPSTAQALLDASEVVDRGEDATLHGTISEWLRAYLAEKSIHPTLEEADEGREPFLDSGDVIIFSGDLKRWLQVRQNERVSQGKLTADLRAFGAKPEVFKLVNQSGETTRSGWRLPAGPWIPPRV